MSYVFGTLSDDILHDLMYVMCRYKDAASLNYTHAYVLGLDVFNWSKYLVFLRLSFEFKDRHSLKYQKQQKLVIQKVNSYEAFMLLLSSKWVSVRKAGAIFVWPPHGH